MLAGAGNGDDDANSDAEFEWYYDAALGIEEAFEDVADTLTCQFCRKEFDCCDEGWYGARKHLVEQHNFGGCNLFLPYHSEPQFRAHLVEHHSMNVSDAPLIHSYQLPRLQVAFRVVWKAIFKSSQRRMKLPNPDLSTKQTYRQCSRI